MLNDFKAFILRGNVVDLAIGVVIGGAFGSIVTSLVNDLLMPIISLVTGGIDFTNLYIPLKGQAGNLPLEEAKKLGAVFAYGSFIQTVVNFVIIAFAIFILIRFINRLTTQFKQQEAAALPPTPTREEQLLTEIRDLLSRGRT